MNSTLELTHLNHCHLQFKARVTEFVFPERLKLQVPSKEDLVTILATIRLHAKSCLFFSACPLGFVLAYFFMTS